MSTPRRGPSQSSSCMCLGPRSYRTDSAPVSVSVAHPLLLPLPPLLPLICTLNEGCNAENALAFNNQEAFSSQQLLSSHCCLPISDTICWVFFFFCPPFAPLLRGEMNITSCLTNIQGHTHSVFDSQDNRAEKQKQEAWVSANIKLNNNRKKNPSHLQEIKKNNAEFLLF